MKSGFDKVCDIAPHDDDRAPRGFTHECILGRDEFISVPEIVHEVLRYHYDEHRAGTHPVTQSLPSFIILVGMVCFAIVCSITGRSSSRFCGSARCHAQNSEAM